MSEILDLCDPGQNNELASIEERLARAQRLMKRHEWWIERLLINIVKLEARKKELLEKGDKA